ncbi:MAG TPA: YeeE/YedE thiosulfate transporter family protein [Burkholderiaceae bacterium]|jgi:uncharacterized membrane protein YedE/YeeE|nr:YeeE/YedE thiosulfate transporter family protein [Burkholderiaceae bacterium]
MIDVLFPLGISHYLIGGLLMGVGVALIFVLTGAVSGMSTVFTSTWSYFSTAPFFQQPRFTATRRWRLALAAGLILGALIWWQWLGPEGGVVTRVTWWQLLAGGFLVGFGARMSNGCTSGHGICGLASLQLPSALAVLTFLATAIAVANLTLWLGGR